MTKLGLHIIDTPPKVLGPMPVVKLVDSSVETCAEVRKSVGRQCLMVYRWYVDQGTQGELLEDPETGAKEFVGVRLAQMSAIHKVAAPVVFEGLNEIPDEMADAYAIFEATRARLTHAHGIGCCLGNWGVGTPDFPVWRRYDPLFEAMNNWDVVGLHEYWPDAQGLQNSYIVGRWRLAWRDRPELGFAKIVVTECGRDYVLKRGKAGWRLSIGAEEYKRELKAYGEILACSSNVLGGTVFTAGRVWPKWRAFDINGEIAEWIVANADGHAGPDAPLPIIGVRTGAVKKWLDLESYLFGVVPAEMPASWPIEALKAQAVAARSWAIANLGRHKADGHDFCAGGHCQAFNDRLEHPRSNMAVRDTQGIVGILPSGRVASMFYSASCGGRTLGDWGSHLRARDDCPCGRKGHRVLGHRRGLCQWGAMYLASEGLSWREILDFYYKGLSYRAIY